MVEGNSRVSEDPYAQEESAREEEGGVGRDRHEEVDGRECFSSFPRSHSLSVFSLN